MSGTLEFDRKENNSMPIDQDSQHYPYSEADFENMCGLIARVPESELDPIELFDELIQLLSFTGNVSADPANEPVWEEPPQNSATAQKQAECCKRLLQAADPILALDKSDDVYPVLNSMVRNKWAVKWKREGRAVEPSLRNISWEGLSLTEQSVFFEIIVSLERNFRCGVRRGATYNSNVDTLLFELAGIWIDQTRFRKGTDDLPKSEKSRFMKFCEIALAPVVPHRTRVALARRWKRITMAS